MVALIHPTEINQMTTTIGMLLVLFAGIILAMMNRQAKTTTNSSSNSSLCPCLSGKDKQKYQSVDADYYASFASQRNSIVRMLPSTNEQHHILIDNY